MSTVETYPGVYVQEIATGIPAIVGVATSVTAFLGRAYRGPVNTPVFISSPGDFQQLFGGLQRDYPLSYAVRDFFQNGGQQAFIVRLYGGAARGTATLPLSAPGDDAATLVLSAADPGDWPNGVLTATVDVDGITPETAAQTNPALAPGDLFNLSVSYTNPDGTVTSERFTRVSVQPDAGEARLDRVLQAGSSLVRYTWPAEGTPAAPPAGATGTASGGVAGEPLQDTDYLGSQDARTGLYALDGVDLFNLMVIPPDQRLSDNPRFPSAEVYQAAAVYCMQHRALLIMDPPFYATPAWQQQVQQGRISEIDPPATLGSYGPEGCSAAIYFPNLVEQDPLMGGQPQTFSPSGAIAGIYARTDSALGVWKAPAGIGSGALSGVQGLELTLDDADNGVLNPLGINCLRSFPIYGSVVWGARTLTGSSALTDDFRYIPVRRLALFIEESLVRGTAWATFEPNAEPLWSRLRQAVQAFMASLFNQGAFAGSSASEAFFVSCDASTTTAEDVASGWVNILVGFAPVHPAEFVAITIRQAAATPTA